MLYNKLFLLRLNFSKYKNVLSIFTHLDNDEKYELYKLSSIIKRNSNIVEIGCYLGASACLLAYGARNKNCKVYCVDTWKNEGMSEGPRDTYQEFTKNTSIFKDIIIPLKDTSEKAAMKFDKKISLIFIDSDHSYEGCKKDIKSWLPHLEKDAIIIFHDYADWALGVKKAVDELIKPIQQQKEIITRSLYQTVI